jgi:hypothetical protein
LSESDEALAEGVLRRLLGWHDRANCKVRFLGSP